MSSSSDFNVEALDWTYRSSHNSNYYKPNWSAKLFERSLANWTFCKSSNLYQMFESPARVLPQ